MSNISGIYQIQSKIKPERIYMGSSIDVNGRRNGHLYELRHNKHHSHKLQRHYNKYSEQDLEFSILCVCSKNQLSWIEQYYIDFYQPYFNECNFVGKSMLGRPLSEEHKRKISQANKGKTTEKSLRNLIPARKGNKNMLGKCHSEETKRRMSISAKGKIKSVETREKISKAAKERWSSEEHREKISEANRGKHPSEETRRRMSEAHKGKELPKGRIPWNKGASCSEETRIKISEANKGRRASEEARERMRGRIPWNKGKKGFQEAWNKGTPRSEEVKQKIRDTKASNKLSKKVA